MMEADIEELWEYYCRKYLDKFGEPVRIRITSRDALILAILDLEETPHEDDNDFD